MGFRGVFGFRDSSAVAAGVDFCYVAEPVSVGLLVPADGRGGGSGGGDDMLISLLAVFFVSLF